MRKFTHLFLVFCIVSTVIFVSNIACAEEETIPSGETAPESVTMSWGKFIRMWDEYQRPDKKRSHSFAYEGALYEGEASVEKDTYYIKFRAVVTITSFTDKKVLVPVISAQLSPERMLLNTNPTGYIQRGGNYCVILQSKGSHTVESSFTVSFDAQRWPRNFELPLVPISKSEVKIRVADADIEAKFEPGVVLETISGGADGEGDQVRGVVPAVGGTTIRWLKRSEKREMIPLKMGAIVHSYVSLAEYGANIKSEIDFKILQGETHYFQIQVPASIDILDVTSIGDKDSISQWYAEDTTNNGRMIHIYASYRHKTRFSVQLDCEYTATTSRYKFTVPRLVPVGVDRYENLIAVGSGENVEIEESEVENAEGRGVRFVPEAIKRFAEGRSLFYYKVLADKFNLTFDVKSHDKASVVKTRIAHLEADSVVTAVGTVMTKATYRVKNNQSQFLKLTLPNNSKLLSAFTNGREVQPVTSGDMLLIPLDKSTEQSFPVEIAWLTKNSGFGVLGRQSLYLPVSPVSMDRLVWRLYTPEDHQVFYFGGNIQHTPNHAFSWFTASIQHGLFDGVATAHAGFSSKSYQYRGSNVMKRFDGGKNQSSDAFNVSARSSQVQVQIPVTGDRYSFSSYLVKGFTPEISFYYMNEAVHKIVGLFYCCLAFLVTFSILAFIFARGKLFARGQSRLVWLLGSGGLGIFAVAVIFLKLGVFAQVGSGIAYATAVFAFWQNRMDVKIRSEQASGKKNYISEVVLILLFLFVAVPLFMGNIALAFFSSSVSIVFCTIFVNVYERVKKRKKLKKDGASLAIVFLMLLCISPVAVDASEPGQQVAGSQSTHSGGEEASTVYLSWPTVEHMLRTIDARQELMEQESKPGYLFGTVKVDGDITERYASLRIDVPLRILTEQFVKIPLVSSTTPITKAVYNGKSLALFESNSKIYFEADTAMEREGILQVYISAPVQEQGGVKEFVVHSPLLQGGDVELRFGEDIKSVKLYNVSWEKREGRVVWAALGNSQRLRGELATFVRKKDSDGKEDKRVKKRYATTYTLVSLEDEIATFYSSIRFRILNEHVREFKIKLPQHVIVHEIVGEDLEGWRVEKGVDGMNTYIIKVMYSVADRYDLAVRFETPMPADKKSFVLPNLLVEGVARDTGFIGLEMQGRGEISLEKLEKARQIDIQELPAIIREDVKVSFVYAFRYIERPHNISFNIRKHKRVQIDPAIADRIEYTRVISPQGALLSQARIWLRNSRKQYVTFQLPEGARLISTFMDGKSIKPSVDEKGTLLLPLKRQSVIPFVLDVVFEDPSLNFKKFGNAIQLDYPQVDVPVSTVTSNIYVPKSMKVYDTSGDFHKTTRVNYVEWTSHQGRQAEKRQVVAMQSIPPALGGEQNGGTHSLKINIPKQGKKVSLNAFYIPAGDSLETRLVVFHKYVYTGGCLLALGLCVILGFLGGKYAQRSLFWGGALTVIGIFYYLNISSWMVLVSCVLGGYLLSYCKRWQTMKKGMLA